MMPSVFLFFVSYFHFISKVCQGPPFQSVGCTGSYLPLNVQLPLACANIHGNFQGPIPIRTDSRSNTFFPLPKMLFKDYLHSVDSFVHVDSALLCDHLIGDCGFLVTAVARRSHLATVAKRKGDKSFENKFHWIVLDFYYFLGHY